MADSLEDRNRSAVKDVRRPRAVIAATVLLGVSAVLYGLIAAAEPMPSLLFLAVYAWFIARIPGGRPKARIVVSVLSVLVAGLGAAGGFTRGWEYMVLFFVALVASYAGVVLMFLFGSDAYFGPLRRGAAGGGRPPRRHG